MYFNTQLRVIIHKLNNTNILSVHGLLVFDAI
jgi:hypothetical protein